MRIYNKLKILIASSAVGLGLLTGLSATMPDWHSLHGHTSIINNSVSETSINLDTHKFSDAYPTLLSVGSSNNTEIWEGGSNAYYGRYVIGTSEGKVYPPQLDDADLGAEITTKELTDAGLYQRLLVIYKTYYGGMPAGKSTLRRDMFKGVDFSAMSGTLDLSGSHIVELFGLELLNFNECIGLNCVNLSNNDLTQIDAAQLESIKYVPSINLTNNALTKVDLTRMENLSYVDLGNNSISSIDLTKVKADDSDATIILNNNNISDLSNVDFRRIELLTHNINLYVVGNPLSSTLTSNSKVKVQVGLLGLNGTSTNIIEGEPLVYNQITNLSSLGLTQELQLVILNESNLNEVAVINNSDANNGINLVSYLSYGKYLMYYRYIDGTSAYRDNHTFVDIDHSPYTITITPSAPTYVIIDQEGNQIKFENNTVNTQDIVVKLTSSAVGGEIYYRFNSNDWVKGNEVAISANQSGTLSFKVVANGVESSEEYINFAINHSFGWTELLIIALVIVGFLLL